MAPLLCQAQDIAHEAEGRIGHRVLLWPAPLLESTGPRNALRRPPLRRLRARTHAADPSPEYLLRARRGTLN